MKYRKIVKKDGLFFTIWITILSKCKANIQVIKQLNTEELMNIDTYEDDLIISIGNAYTCIDEHILNINPLTKIEKIIKTFDFEKYN